MRAFKLLVTFIILCLIAIFVYQNMQTWTQTASFRLNLYFFKSNPTRPPSLELYTVILLSALCGFIVGVLLLLKPYFRTRRMLKRERQEKKQAEEEFTLRLARAESHGEAASPAADTVQAQAPGERAESEKAE